MFKLGQLFCCACLHVMKVSYKLRYITKLLTISFGFTSVVLSFLYWINCLSCSAYFIFILYLFNTYGIAIKESNRGSFVF